MAKIQAEEQSGWPSGIPFIIGNEAAERFSYYGMRTILVVFMTEYLLGANGELDPMSETDARAWYHVFSLLVYLLPILGSILSDGILGKYKTILSLSVVYCFGHLALALDETRTGLAIGLGLIALGSGGIKPCVSAHVGDQFGAKNQHLLPKVFSWFYFSVNFGSTFATLLTPVLLREFGPHVAFGLPGALMFLATFVFWLGRNRFVHVPPAGKQFIKELWSLDGLRKLGPLLLLLLFFAPFYAIFEQSGSAWVLQAKKLDLDLFGFQILPAQVHAVNPIMVMLLAPLFAYGLYPKLDRFVRITALRKIGVGFVIAATAFIIPACLEFWLAKGEQPSVWWQVLATIILTIAEVLVTIPALEFFYTQSPKSMKSLVMALKYLSISLGNGFAALVNLFIRNPNGEPKLSGVNYYLFFAAVMVVTAMLFVVFARRFKDQSVLRSSAS